MTASTPAALAAIGLAGLLAASQAGAAARDASPRATPSVSVSTPAPSRAQQLMGDIAPKLAQLTDEVLFGDVWARGELSRRDRSLVTVSALVAMHRREQLRSHLALARENGLTEQELVEAITHLAFYAGWPNAVAAIQVAREVFANPAPVARSAAGSVSVVRPGDAPPTAGAPDHFTGAVRVDARFQRESPARLGGGLVSFAPGARTAWHTHPLGQTLIVTAGAGWVQAWGEPARAIAAGDIAWIPPGVKHWHGAGADTPLSHAALSEALDGTSVQWLEHVDDAHDRGPAPAATARDPEET